MTFIITKKNKMCVIMSAVGTPKLFLRVSEWPRRMWILE